MKLLRILLAIILLLILVCVLAVAALVIFIDPNKMKPAIIEEVRKQTSYQLNIDGPLSWSFYPILGFKIEHMTLSAPPQANPFIELSGVQIETQLAQILHRNQKLDGNVYIANVNLANVHAQDVRATVHWAHKILTVEAIKAALYDGKLAGVVHARELSTLPVWDWDLRLDHVQVKPLLSDVLGPNHKLNISGIGKIKFQATAKGNSRDEFLNNMNGSSLFSIENGAVEGVDLNYLIMTADALINKQPVTAPSNINQTQFEILTGTTTIKNGIANIDNLLLVSLAILAKGEGSVALTSQVINLQMQVKSQQNLKSQWEIPVLITGNLMYPDVRLDTSEIQKLLTQEQIDKLKAKASDEIKKHIPGEPGEFIQNLLIGH